MPAISVQPTTLLHVGRALAAGLCPHQPPKPLCHRGPPTQGRDWVKRRGMDTSRFVEAEPPCIHPASAIPANRSRGQRGPEAPPGARERLARAAEGGPLWFVCSARAQLHNVLKGRSPFVPHWAPRPSESRCGAASIRYIAQPQPPQGVVGRSPCAAPSTLQELSKATATGQGRTKALRGEQFGYLGVTPTNGMQAQRTRHRIGRGNPHAPVPSVRKVLGCWRCQAYGDATDCDQDLRNLRG